MDFAFAPVKLSGELYSVVRPTNGDLQAMLWNCELKMWEPAHAVGMDMLLRSPEATKEMLIAAGVIEPAAPIAH